MGGKVKTPKRLVGEGSDTLIDASSIQLTADRSNVPTPTRRTQEPATDLSEIGLVIALLLTVTSEKRK